MAKVDRAIYGTIISPKSIEVLNGNRTKLIPGQKVLVYKTTGNKIVDPDGRVIGEKEKILGSGEVKLYGEKLIVDSLRKKDSANINHLRNMATHTRRHRTIKGSRIMKSSSNGTVFIKPIDE